MNQAVTLRDVPGWAALVVSVALAIVVGASCGSPDMDLVPPEQPPSEDGQSVAGARTNVIVVLLDDLDTHGFEQLMADPSLMPNVRAYLADGGTQFTQSFVSNSVCCPSRATFLTGKYSHNNGTYALFGLTGGYGVFSNIQNDALGAWMQDAGYWTAHMGKYMNGYAPLADGGQVVPGGWSEWQGLLDYGTYDFYDYKVREKYQTGGAGSPWVDTVSTYSWDGGLFPDGGSLYSADYLAQKAADFISRWSTHHASQPFFLALTPAQPHVEAYSKTGGDLRNHAGQFAQELRPKGWNRNRVPYLHYGRLRAVVGGKVDEFTPVDGGFDLPSRLVAGSAWNEADLSDKHPYLTTGTIADAGWPLLSTTFCDGPAFLQDDGGYCRATAGDGCGSHLWRGPADGGCEAPGTVRTFEQMLRRLHLERLESMLAIDELVGKVARATIAANAADNTVIIFTSDNGYFLGEHRLVNKQQPYEEGARVPLLVRSPYTDGGRFRTNDSLVVNTDWAATILDYGGARATHVDGRSLRSVAENPGTRLPRKRLLLEHYFGRNNGASIVLWDVPDYVGVRTTYDAGTAVDNTTYVEYFAPQTPTTAVAQADAGFPWDGRLSGMEYFRLSQDPYQLQSLHAQADATTASQRLRLQEHLYALASCKGTTCQLLEDRADPAYRIFLPSLTAGSPPADGGLYGFEPGEGDWAGITLQNASGATATATALFFSAGDDRVWAETRVLPGNSNTVIIPASLSSIPAGFVGSGVVVADRPIVAVVNHANKRLSATVGLDAGTSGAQYVSVDQSRTGNELRFPLVKKSLGNKSTAVYVQNATDLPVTLSASYVLSTTGVAYPYSVTTVPPRRSVMLSPHQVSSAPNGLYSLTVTAGADAKLAGISYEYEVSGSAPVVPALRLQAANGYGKGATFTDYSQRVHFPMVKRLRNGHTTGQQVQNVGTSTVTVRLNYLAGPACQVFGTPYQEATLSPGASATFYDYAGLDGGAPGCLTSAYAEATPTPSAGLFVGVANERCNGSCTNTLTQHSAVPAERLSRALLAPMFKENLYGKQTSLLVTNPNGQATTASASFTLPDGGAHVCNVALPANGQVLFTDMSAFTGCLGGWGGARGALPDSTITSVTVDAGLPIAGVATEADLNGIQDDAAYEPFNLP